MIELLTRQRTSRRSRTRAGLAPVVLAASVVAALVSGCSGGSDDPATTAAAPPPTELPDGAQIVQESARTTQTLQSVHLTLNVNNIPNLPVEMVDADVTNQPEGSGQAMGEAKVRTAENEPFIETKFLVVDKTLYAAQDGVKYAPVGPAEKMYDPGVILDKDKGLANAIAQVQNPQVEKRETINGVETVKVTGTISGSVIDPIVPRVGDGIGELPITLWIQDVAPPTTSAAPLPSSAASPGTGPNLIKAEVTKDQGSVELELSDHGKPVTVAKPAG
ncbi:LppX_LprAFG lipoprotein [Nocardia sp. CC227C]|uniref:LppX_LprAFG lipoprotein n=1 Tax=Nocardia sp. CC227C TaxID=3044562 RepID=UPI00278BD40C|nr:LppX_LprAFG lipoprotein [Nocardia sp. CC227C]